MDIPRDYPMPANTSGAVEPGSGCVFCDLDLEAKQAGLMGSFYHEVKASGTNGLPTNRFIRCPVKSK